MVDEGVIRCGLSSGQIHDFTSAMDETNRYEKDHGILGAGPFWLRVQDPHFSDQIF